MGDLISHRMPWEPVPVEDTIKALQRDMAYLVAYTAVTVHSNREELRRSVNTRRGQIVPRGTATYADGTVIEFQDIGAPQPGLSVVSVEELVNDVVDAATRLGLGAPL